MEENRCNGAKPFVERPERALSGEEHLLIERLIASMTFPDDTVDEVILGPKSISRQPVAASNPD